MMRTSSPLLLALGALVVSALATVSHAAAESVAPAAEFIRPILVGTELPNAAVETVAGDAIGLRDALGKETSVLVVYRGGWCPFCNMHLSELQEVVPELKQLGVEMYAVSADRAEVLRPGLDRYEIGFTLLADYELRAAKALGLAFHVSDEYVQKLAEYDLDTSGNAVSGAQVLPVPAVFVVDAEGIVTFSYVNPNYKVRCDPGVLMAAVRAAVGPAEPNER